MKKIFLTFVLFCTLFITSAIASEVAVINFEEIIKNSTAMEKINKSLEAKKTDLEKKFKAREQALNDEKNTLESQIKTLSQDIAQKKVLDFQQKVVNFQKEVKDSENTLQKNYMDAVIELTNKTKEIIIAMKKEKNSKYKFDVVIPSSSVIYNEKNIDISAEVLSRLNKQLKTMTTVTIK